MSAAVQLTTMAGYLSQRDVEDLRHMLAEAEHELRQLPAGAGASQRGPLEQEIRELKEALRAKGIVMSSAESGDASDQTDTADAALATWNGVTGRVVRHYSLAGAPWLLVVTEEGTLSWPAAEAQTMGSALKTRVVAGHSISIRVGVRYRASRPMAERGRTKYPVTIAPIDGSGAPSIVIDGLSYDQANELINAFNNGDTSFDGRVWMARGSDSQFAELVRLHCRRVDLLFRRTAHERRRSRVGSSGARGVGVAAGGGEVVGGAGCSTAQDEVVSG